MKKLVFAAIAAVTFGVALAEETAAPAAEKPKVPRSELIRRSQMKQFGGMVVRPGSLKGKVVIANATATVDDAVLEKIATEYKKLVKITIETAKSEKPSLANVSALVEKLDAEAVLFVTDDASLPPLLCAPESRWTIVNIAGLSKGGATAPVLAGRIRKEVSRGFAYLAGAANSTFSNSLMSAVTKPQTLDYLNDEMPPVEVVARFPEYLKGLGVTPILHVTYKQACQEGWAPAPTNEYQQVFWNLANGEPKNPIKITK